MPVVLLPRRGDTPLGKDVMALLYSCLPIWTASIAPEQRKMGPKSSSHTLAFCSGTSICMAAVTFFFLCFYASGCLN